MKHVFLSCLIIVSAVAWAQVSAQPYRSIRPGQPWADTKGKPIHAHSPQIFAKDGVYYWYGENKERTVSGSNVWTWGIRAYRSTDFYNWQDLGLIIEPDTLNPLSPLHYSQTLDRPHILYNKTTGKWVCWIKSMDTDGYFVILQADRFEGPYSVVRSLKPEGFGVGDFDMYADPETGRAYVWFERPHWEMICAELTDDYLGTNGKYSEHFVGLRPPYTREAPAHFIRQGRHYMFTSGTTGYVPNPSQVCVFDDYHGEYQDLGCPHIDDKWQDSFASQIACVFCIPGTDCYVALADRWLPQFAGTDVSTRTVRSYAERYKEHKPFDRDFTVPQVKDKTGKRRGKWDTTADSRYVFLPITFNKDGNPTIEWQDEWQAPLSPDIAPITAPFPMPQLARPAIGSKKTEVKMPRQGMATKAIQQAIDRQARQGGGQVTIPAGRWKTGRLQLKSGVDLHLSDGCELHFSGCIKDYLPVVFTRDEGIEIQSLGAFIYANGAHDIALTGQGRIVGPATDCEIYQNNMAKAINIEQIVMPDTPIEGRIFDGQQNGGAVFLPKSVAPINCRDVLIEGITIDSSLYWNVVPQYCENVIIRGVTVNSFGHGRTDGIDIESSRNVLVEYCSLDCQDDCYTMKSGRGLDGLRVGRPTENVVLRYNLARRGAGGIVCGTEVAGGIRNIYMHDCIFDGTDQAFRFKTLRPRGGGVENVTIERIRARVKDYAFYCDLLGSRKWGGNLTCRYGSPDKQSATAAEKAALQNSLTPDFHSITVSDVVIEDCRQLVKVIGMPERPLRNVLFSHVKGKAKEFLFIRDAAGFVLSDVDVSVQDSTATVDGCESLFMLDTHVNGLPPNDIKYIGEPSTVTVF